MKERLQGGLGSRRGHARFQPSEHVYPAAPAILETVKFRELRANLGFHHDGDANLRRRAGTGAVKSFPADANYGERVTIDQQLLADDIAAAAEASPPVTVADDRDGVAARGSVVIGRDDASQGRGHAEDLKVGAGDEFAVDALGFPFGADAHRSFPPAEHSTEDLVVVAKILVHGVGELVLPVVAAVMRTTAPQQDELLGVLDWQQAQEDLVHQGEDGGVGADA
jgi:hypothetical protein